MSTLKATNFQHPSAGAPAIVLDADGDATYAGLHDFTSATVTGAGGLRLVTPTSIANSGGSASLSGGKVSFTGVTSISLNGIFTSTYDNYRVVFVAKGASSTAITVAIRYRLSGVDNAGSNYYYGGVYVTHASGPTRDYSGGNTYGLVGLLGDYNGTANFDILSPNIATNTTFVSQYEGAGGATAQYGTSSGLSTETTAHDGLTILMTSSTMTGAVRVYGYQNS